MKFKIDQTPPSLTETAVPTEIKRIRRGVMVPVNYSGTAGDSGSGLSYPPNTALIDEYGVLNKDLGYSLSGIVEVEAWCDGGDKDGRIYIIRLTAYDLAGNKGTADAIVTVLK